MASKGILRRLLSDRNAVRRRWVLGEVLLPPLAARSGAIRPRTTRRSLLGLPLPPRELQPPLRRSSE